MPSPTAPKPQSRVAEVRHRGGRESIRALSDLTRVIQSSRGFPEVVAALKVGHGATIDGAWGSAAPLVTAALALHCPSTLLCVIPHVGDLDDFRDDLSTFARRAPLVFPAWEGSLREAEPGDETIADRLRITRRVTGALPPKLILAPISALLQPVPSRDWIERCSRSLSVGQTVEVESLCQWLVERGMTRSEVVEIVGEFSLRGGILDIYPADAGEPVRIEFFGDEIESIRPFDPGTQRSLETWQDVTLTIVPPLDLGRPEQLTSLTELLPPESWIALIEPNDLRDQAKQYLDRVDDRRGLFSFDGAFIQMLRRPTVTLATFTGGSLEATCHLRVESVERFSGELQKVKAELEGASKGESVVIACHNQGEVERLTEVFADTALSAEKRLTLTVGHVHAGFRIVNLNTLIIGDHELFDRSDLRPGAPRRRYESRAIDSFLDLNEGDLVVHINHGIGRYRGLQLLEKANDFGEETLVLDFADGAKLYVPISKVDLVQKYVGGGRLDPPLSKLGGSAWEKRKQRVADAVVDLAAELVDIQAKRNTSPGIAYPLENTRWQTEFEMAFPYQETPDQLKAIDDVRGDMGRPRPMDRLVCGDVGYGKTEVAMRAAFRAVEAGKQVAVLVPTTILAEQHHRTFSARMAEYPFTIAVINRFRPRSEVKEVLRRVATGGVDLLIGTHRLVQKDVIFKDLGLVIIDEEQRFGVEDKEWLKSLRTTVDVLTLSATPIPRTLHMSLLGIRDISNLETPPPDRKSIETRITRFDPELVRHAVLRELNRDGQVYFVHNRVYDIEAIAQRVQAIVPEARILIGHGQMTGERLESTMIDFIDKKADILVATTIIESGVDIPNVNTIFINDADNFGLADLHQLRGRVGRFKHRAYAYMMVDPKRTLAANAVKRLKAIEEYTDLGAGFKIALRDLEIRGAGNILGAEQSGHIEAVGYELYCTLLETAVRTMTRLPEKPRLECSVELAWRAYLPRNYVSSPKVKVELYRRLARIHDLQALAEFERELLDRFGPLPPAADNLMRESEIRVIAQNWKIDRIHIDDEYIVLTYRSAIKIDQLAKSHPRGYVRVVDDHSAYIPLEKKRPPGHEVLPVLKALLCVDPDDAISRPGVATTTKPVRVDPAPAKAASKERSQMRPEKLPEPVAPEAAPVVAAAELPKRPLQARLRRNPPETTPS